MRLNEDLDGCDVMLVWSIFDEQLSGPAWDS
jgi:hypothetical protein